MKKSQYILTAVMMMLRDFVHGDITEIYLREEEEGTVISFRVKGEDGTQDVIFRKDGTLNEKETGKRCKIYREEKFLHMQDPNKN